MATIRFNLGDVYTTPRALAILEASGESPLEFLDRHRVGDWGSVCEEDSHLNDDAVHDGTRILSVYHTALGDTLWVITDAADEEGNRPSTTLLVPEDY